MPPRPAAADTPGRGRGAGRGRGTGRGRGAGRKPVQQKITTTPTPSHDPGTTLNPAITITELVTPDPNRLQTRQSNKNTHPGAAHHAYTTVRRSAEEVQAEREQLEKVAQAAESARLQKVASLAAYEDCAQQKNEEYNQNFAHPLRPETPTAKTTPQTIANHKTLQPSLKTPVRSSTSLTPLRSQMKTPEEKASEREELLRRLAELDTGGDTDGSPDIESRQTRHAEEEPNSEHAVEVQDDSVEKPGPVHDLPVPSEAPTDLSKKKTRGASQTSRSEINNARATLPTVQSLYQISSNPTLPNTLVEGDTKKRKKPSDGEKPTQPHQGRLKRNKTTTEATTPIAAKVGGLKKNVKSGQKGRQSDNQSDSMLQEGQSIGFDDNTAANSAERQQAGTSAQAQASGVVRITAQPLTLPTGRDARGGDSKFSSKHLPDFIRQNDGARKIFTPLSKEAAGFVHSWSTLHRDLLQGIIDRGWGDGKVTIPDTPRNAVTAVGNIKTSDLRHELGIGALTIVKSFIEEHWSDSPQPFNPEEELDWVFRSEDDIAKWATWQTQKFSLGNGPQLSPFLFDIFVGDEEGRVIEKKGMFENELILRVLALYLTHVDSIPPNIKRLEGFPFGALELSIQAVERALVAYVTGNVMVAGDFSYDDWGKKPAFDSKGRQKVKATEFRKTIESLRKEKQDAIINGARLYVKTKGRSARARRQNIPPEDLEEDVGSDSDVMMSDPPEPATVTSEEAAAIESAQSLSSSGITQLAAGAQEEQVSVDELENGLNEIEVKETVGIEGDEPQIAGKSNGGEIRGSESDSDRTQHGPA
ncbi:hypothetical protein PQX77_000928 [Marasmius sp. AFHP31]|nr:hypothetical protein PQX77_000928 [Marasmius sp. AFHP31]